MTTEAAVTKLAYLFSRHGDDAEAVAAAMQVRL
jgi:hypothetical protein